MTIERLAGTLRSGYFDILAGRQRDKKGGDTK